GSTCVAGACVGACCVGFGPASCSELTAFQCGTVGGLFGGVGTNCDEGNPCYGACCDSGGFCSDGTSLDICSGQSGGGAFHPNLLCSEVNCPAPLPDFAHFPEHTIACGGSDTS